MTNKLEAGYTAAFTTSQIEAWRAFEKVRAGGRFNMFDPKARRATGLTPEEYSFTMKNFSELKDAALAKAGK